ncbi:hypothetical protein VOLCADRAFT_95016 [Volvox carteri f. nagariensis]|uniref:Uncharacterized protein n=1 Tax=Volvox carteri f. nagariensis TaxID=3068 RepID=D8U6D6_VOLCA|nr:uncharacterized protein VOLCADRAFT_95016 [Volvox carteri f. nagariensis]EFJ44698.1 hypothetical protein VOLCADRAFT_95016 [Volvox carteri f. nagariensis]|eukprot:XP_002954274.1 hypothetical protein VOLCADRAFT_95016 [Volvox carteri f. nagariensis]
MAQHWTNELPPVAACDLVPKLPPLLKLRQVADAAVKTPAGGATIFNARALYDAVRELAGSLDIPQHKKAAATLLIASTAMEDYVRSHSTKARLLSLQQAHIARVAADQADVTGVTAEQEKLLQFLTTSSPAEVADKLLALLKEPEEKRKELEYIVMKRGPREIATILAATMKAITDGDTERSDGTGSRTPGGIFFREAKRHKAVADKVMLQPLLLPAPPMRSYQRHVVGMALVSWGLELTREVLRPREGEMEEAAGGGVGGVGESATDLRAKWQSMADGWKANWLVSAPTNSGKTRMFIEVARAVIASKQLLGRGAIVVVLVPSVILTRQHAHAFDEARLPCTLTSAYSSDSPLGPKAWRSMFLAAFSGGNSSVVVATAESFANLLRTGKALLQEVDLLVRIHFLIFLKNIDVSLSMK